MRKVDPRDCSLDLLAERAALLESGQATCWLTEHDVAVSTKNHGLRMAVYRCDLKASWAFNVHEETVWRLNHALELVLCLLLLGIWVQEIDVHFLLKHSAKARRVASIRS